VSFVSVTGEGIVVWWDYDDQYGAIVTPGTEPWEIRCDAAVLVGDYNIGQLREGNRVRVEYGPADVGGFRWVASAVRRLPYDPAVLEPVVRDVATVEQGAREWVVRVADQKWSFSADEASLVQYVVDEVQQDFHDLFIDTEWPACPRHPNHPMWYSDGHWRCATDGVAIVPLGELSRLGD
jgi:hypothetical protein